MTTEEMREAIQALRFEVSALKTIVAELQREVQVLSPAYFEATQAWTDPRVADD